MAENTSKLSFRILQWRRFVTSIKYFVIGYQFLDKDFGPGNNLELLARLWTNDCEIVKRCLTGLNTPLNVCSIISKILNQVRMTCLRKSNGGNSCLIFQVLIPGKVFYRANLLNPSQSSTTNSLWKENSM